MKTRRLVGGAVVGALVLGIWLGSLWKGFGLGGAGSGLVPDTGTVHVSNAPPAASSSGPAPAESSGSPTGGLLTVVIHGAQYRLATDSDPQSGLDVPLDEIQRRVSVAKGTPEGIRVRILKEKSAQEGARSDLLSALLASGVKREEIQERAEFVE